MDSQKKKLLLTAIIAFTAIIFLFLRFYLLDQRIIFDWDQERDANQIKDLIISHKPTLIGPRVVSENGFFLAPYYTYILTPFYVLSHLNPIGGMYLIIVSNLLFLIVGIVVIKKLFGAYQAVAFMALWGINVLLINYDTIPWNPLLIPLWIMFLFGLLNTMFQQQRLWQWLLLGLLLGVGINLHVQFIFIILFVLLFMIMAKKKMKINWKKILFVFISFLITFVPLFLFDVRHDWLNGKLFLNFFFGSHTTKDLFAWLPVLDNFLQPVTFKIPLLVL